MEDRLKNIIEEYNNIKDSLEPEVYENLEKEIQDKKQELDREKKRFIALKTKIYLLNTAGAHSTSNNYNWYIQRGEAKINSIKKVYETKLSQKEKIDEARENVKNKLISEKEKIEAEIKEQELELKSIELQLKNFKHEYEEREMTWEDIDDEKKFVTVTKKVKVCTNGKEYKKLNDRLKEKNIICCELREAKSKCEEYLDKIDNYKKDTEKIDDIDKSEDRTDIEREHEEEVDDEIKRDDEKIEEREHKDEKDEEQEQEQEDETNNEREQKNEANNVRRQGTRVNNVRSQGSRVNNLTRQANGTELVMVIFNAKKNSYNLVIKGKNGYCKEESKSISEIKQSEDFITFITEYDRNYRNAIGGQEVDECVAYMLNRADEILGQNRLDNYIRALGKEAKMSDNTAIRYDLNGIINGIYGRNYSKITSNDIIKKVNYHEKMGLANVADKSEFIKFMEKHKYIRAAFQSLVRIGNTRNETLGNKQLRGLAPGETDESERKKFTDRIKILKRNIKNKAKTKGKKQRLRNERLKSKIKSVIEKRNGKSKENER